ncbi:shikimate dehydrogenase [Mesorhizobium sp. CAU 1741]|uniref:shikimate dehydrogenase n=1 Tax=Mesorhizobium sp. CAU 1741 TaxID=3140366 RepID=UPI00325C2FA8
MRKAFVIGHPIAHSRSPMIHGHWLEVLAIDGCYERIDVAPGDLANFVRQFRERGFAGGNVTIPHKEATLVLADRLDEAAELIGAVNTLWLDDDLIHGGNTDAIGFSANLDAAAYQWRDAESALVLGAGGAARAVVHALVQAGIRDIRLVNRTVMRAQELADRFGAGISAHGWHEVAELSRDAALVVNTTSLGMHGDGGSLMDVALLPDHAIVTDIVYVPLRTPLLAEAAARGLRTVDGLGMLLHQAVPGFERWFGHRPVVTTALRDIVVADLERHG